MFPLTLEKRKSLKIFCVRSAKEFSLQLSAKNHKRMVAVKILFHFYDRFFNSNYTDISLQ